MEHLVRFQKAFSLALEQLFYELDIAETKWKGYFEGLWPWMKMKMADQVDILDDYQDYCNIAIKIDDNHRSLGTISRNNRQDKQQAPKAARPLNDSRKSSTTSTMRSFCQQTGRLRCARGNFLINRWLSRGWQEIFGPWWWHGCTRKDQSTQTYEEGY